MTHITALSTCPAGPVVGSTRESVRAETSERPVRRASVIGLMRALALAVPLALALGWPAPAAALEQKLIASDGAASATLGDSVEGDTIVAGAIFDDVGANANQGSAYNFARTGAPARTETAKLTASDGAASERRPRPGKGQRPGRPRSGPDARRP